MASPVDICLVTTGHPSTNPRLVKELSATIDAGYRVHVVACKFVEWADKADAEFREWDCSWSWVRFGPLAGIRTAVFQKLRQRAAAAVASRLVTSWPLVRIAHYALHPASRDLVKATSKVRAGLYIAHNLASLPAALQAAQLYGGRCGFDAEDFHRGEFEDTGSQTDAQRYVERLEEACIPRCDYVTAASDGIGEAYAQTLGVPRPTTILNVFSKSDASFALSESERTHEKPEGITSIYWFSQTIGPGRGLEDMVKALPQLPQDYHLSVRGQWSGGFEAFLGALARSIGVDGRIRWLPPVSPQEMVARAACHDIGLATEQANCLNREICVTNKIFTYLLAQTPCVVTNTTGQTSVAQRFSEVTRIVEIGDSVALADAIRDLHSVRPPSSGELRHAANVMCWEREKARFLDIVRTNAPERCHLDEASVGALAR